MADGVYSGLIKDHNCDLVTRLALLLLELSEPSGCLRELTLLCSGYSLRISFWACLSPGQDHVTFISLIDSCLTLGWVACRFLLSAHQSVWGLGVLACIFHSVVSRLRGGSEDGERSAARLERMVLETTS